ncbi:MAG TPA: cob(I)yrinic acid a,c-diamide adenosyltransferase, partial [Sphingomonas sp.]
MAAIGDVDEANSLIGVARLHCDHDGESSVMLGRIQNELFDLGADLATPPAGGDFAPGEMSLRIVADQIARLEREIDAMNESLPPLRSFILPGGDISAAHLHVARAVVRRAERTAVSARAAGVELNPLALTYLNRLSDHLFTLCRALNAASGGEPLWQPGATRTA